MAYFDSVVTNYGAQILADIIANGGTLQLTSAAAGKGRYTGNPANITALVDPVTIPVDMGEKSFDSVNGVVRIPVQITNQGISQSVPIREVAIYGTHNGSSFIFGYSWLVGDDSDNIIDPSRSADSADTIHIQDVGLFITNQEAASITIQIGGGTYVSQNELHIYAAEKDHTHQASEISETTGESTEVAQRRQDYDIASIKEQLDTGFTGTTLTHTVKAAELDEWTGYTGSGYPEGIYDDTNARLYA